MFKQHVEDFMNLELVRTAPPHLQQYFRRFFIAGLARGAGVGINAMATSEEALNACCIEMNQLSLSTIQSTDIKAEATAVVAGIEALIEGHGQTRQ